MKFYDENGEEVVFLNNNSSNNKSEENSVVNLLLFIILISTCANTFMLYKMFTSYNEIIDKMNILLSSFNSFLRFSSVSFSASSAASLLKRFIYFSAAFIVIFTAS